MLKLKKWVVMVASFLMLIAVCVGFAACGDKLGKVKEDSIRYDGAKITWEAADNAEGYIITINEGSSKYTKNTSYTYKAKTSETEVAISICAVGEDDEEEGETTYRTFTRLETIQKDTVTFDEAGVMSWPDVSGADSYVLSIGGEEIVVSDTSYEEFPTGKSLSIKVRPTSSDGLSFSDWSGSFTKTYLNAPETIKYDGAELTWKGVTNAQSYEVYIDGDLFQATSTRMEYNAEMESFTVQIKSTNASPDVYPSQLSEEKEFIFLPVITELEVADGQLRWPEMDEAESYNYQIGSGAIRNTTDNFINLETGVPLDIKVRPVTSGEVYFSDWSNSKHVHILAAPKLQWEPSATLENGEEARAITWAPVTAAEGYQVHIVTPDGSEDSFAADSLNFLYAFNQTGGKYKVTVKATTTAEGVYSSAYSAAIIVERLAAPTLRAQKPIVSDPKDNSSFQVTWNMVANASGYQIYKNNNPVNDVKISTYTATISNAINAEETGAVEMQYMIQTRGAGVTSLTGGEQSVTLSSIIPREGMGADTCHFTSKSMAQPTNLNCEGWYMTWNGVAQEYAVAGLLADNVATTISAQYDLHNIEPGLKHLSVCAQGNGADVLASHYTPTINVERLGKPENIHVVNSYLTAPEISWDPVNHASGYTMRLNESEESQNVNIGDRIADDYIKNSGLTLSLTAVANAWEDKVYYVTSQESAPKTFYKIETPTFNKQIVRNSDTLVWNAPSNVAAVGESFTYALYANDILWVQSLTSPSITMNELQFEPGVKYTLQVKCIGDTTCISSDISAEVDLIVLDSPELQRTTGVAKYTWEPLASLYSPTAYEISVDGKVVATVPYSSTPDADYYSYAPNTITENGKTYRVEIRALGNDGMADGSPALVTSNPKVIQQQVKRLNQPTFTISYKVDGVETMTYDPNGQIEVTIPADVPYAKAYEYYVGGSSYEVEGLTYSRKPDSTGSIVTKVKAIGGTFDEEGYYYISSDYTKDFTVQIHNAVNSSDISINRSGLIAWGASSPYPAGGYTVKVYVQGEAVIEKQCSARENYIQIDSSKFSKVYKVEVWKNSYNTMPVDGLNGIYEIGSTVAVQTFNFN